MPSAPTLANPPLLVDGDRLNATEFLHRWERMPELKRAELIDGRVRIMSSPVSSMHGDPHFLLIGWLDHYLSLTPGLRGSDNVTTILGNGDVVQPDAQINLPPSDSDVTSVSDDGYIRRAPDLVLEIAHSSGATDASSKFSLYERAGVGEYLICQVAQRRLDWWTRVDGRFELIAPDGAGVVKSRRFPGLCLAAELVFREDRAGLRKLVEQACAGNAEHAALCKRLAGKGLRGE